MPNGHRAVPGLEVMLFNRTEQCFPRLEWDQSHESFAAAEVSAASGYVARGELELSALQPRSFEGLVEAVRRLVAAPQPNYSGPLIGSVAFVDFGKRAGWAAGGFWAYAFSEGRARVLHDHSIAALSGQPAAPHDVAMTCVDAGGLHHGLEPAPAWRFELSDADALVVSNLPLHLDRRWPPPGPVEAVGLALSSTRPRDALIALYRSDPPR